MKMGWIAVSIASLCLVPFAAFASDDRSIDADRDGLIDISSLEGLRNIRHNRMGTGYRESASATDNTAGCPENSCVGYELTRSLDFADPASYDAGVVNSDWIPDHVNPDRATNAGWQPIGGCNDDIDGTIARCGDADDEPFAAIFEGNGYTITNLYTRGSHEAGLFGSVGAGAEIRAVGLIAGNSYGGAGHTDHVGALVGRNDGAIIASYATGDADGGAGDGDNVGSLVGLNAGTIIASYATGDADGGAGGDNVGALAGSNVGAIIASHSLGDSTGGAFSISGGGHRDSVGALVGWNDGAIVASYAVGAADGGGGDFDDVGALVGRNDGSITASYALGDADGGIGNYGKVGSLVGANVGSITASYAVGDADDGFDISGYVGALVGWNIGSITASYAVGDADGGSYGEDNVGALTGKNTASGIITASYGFGAVMGAETPNTDGMPPADITTGAVLTDATALALANAGAQWNDAARDTLNAWDFGTASQPPALRYADYDGTGADYDCDMFPATLLDGVAITCGTTLIPGQGR